MISALLITGAIGLIAGALIATFWKEITSWLGRAIEKIKQALNIVIEGSEVFLQKTIYGCKEVSYHYSKQPDLKWCRHTVIKKEFVDVSELPDDIIAKYNAANLEETTNITEQTEAVLLKLKR